MVTYPAQPASERATAAGLRTMPETSLAPSGPIRLSQSLPIFSQAKTINFDVFDAAMNFYVKHFQFANALLKLNRSSMTVNEYTSVAENMAAPDPAFDVIKPDIHNRNWYQNPEKRNIQTLGYLIHEYRFRPGFAYPRDRLYGLLAWPAMPIP
ncbi:hypothetical protein PC9H_009130 [Pleurotus ostreatus]|uniref:Uncharacterized protein n=1 Tax=Pleurotus ostreatus TaxID=5322 RepID=A0A8H6ZUG5_PLEOS|nr:uncharacterized protein PC9H_009130 [Pleurotus ostreatus]KAF7426761.1 hypothetical protein PC9H_009130 [Pleurotus ostreatus]